MTSKAALLFVPLALWVGCSRNVPSPEVATTQTETIARGKQLVSIGGCTDCHTPMKFNRELGMPVPDNTRYLSGHPEGAPKPGDTISGQDQALIGPTFTSFRAPFGVVYSANLTPDKETGLGNWTEQMFIQAMRTGRHQGGSGRPILPPMPWANLAAQSDADLKAIFAYLQSLPPMANAVPEPEVAPEALAGIAASYDKLLSAQPH